MRRLLNRIYFSRKFGARIDSSSVGIRCQFGSGTQVKTGAVVRSSTLGRECYVNRGAEIYDADIGPYCSVGQLAQIGPNEHLTDEMTTCNALFGEDLSRKLAHRNAGRTEIGADVWVGARAVVLRNNRIGTGAIIAAGAVVTHDIPDYCIAVGLPARVKAVRFSEQRVADLVESEWWTKPPSIVRRSVDAARHASTSDEKALIFLETLVQAEEEH